ncbi:MAG: aconitase family protein, partial [Frankia sp.]
SEQVSAQMAERGHTEVLERAGFIVHQPGCSMCVGMNGAALVGREVCASTSTRNFKGRQGSATGRTLLMSPTMVAAAAMTGSVVDVRSVAGS